MTRLYLDRFRAHALGHEAFEIGIDGPIFRGHSVPARLRPPCRAGRLVRQQRPFERSLDSTKDSRLFRRHVGGEVAQKCFLTQPSPIVRPNYAGGGWRRRIPACERGVVLTRIGRARRDVNKGRNLGIDTSLGQDHAAERMRDQNCRPLLPCQNLPCCLDGRLQRRQRILHCRGLNTLCLQPCDDFGPARPVRKKAVYQDDIFRLGYRLRTSGGHQKRTRGGRNCGTHKSTSIHRNLLCRWDSYHVRCGFPASGWALKKAKKLRNLGFGWYTSAAPRASDVQEILHRGKARSSQWFAV